MFLVLFKETTATMLPKHTKYNHKIPLKLGIDLLNQPLYPLASEKLEALRVYI